VIQLYHKALATPSPENVPGFPAIEGQQHPAKPKKQNYLLLF
jgi:hypothetical protein